MSHLLDTNPYRGTRDFLPAEMSIRKQIFQKLFDTIESYGYGRYDGPILEPAEIYEAKSGQEIANQQLYSLVDRGGRRLALRPEMTPSAARIVAKNIGQLQFPVRWYSHVICHRYERPQRGRVREHWQINVDIFGTKSPNSEIELFELVHDMMGSIGATREMWELRVGDRVLLDSVIRDVVKIPEEYRDETFALIDRWAKYPEEKIAQDAEQIGLTTAQFHTLKEALGSGSGVLDMVSEEALSGSAIPALLAGPTRDLIIVDPFIVRGLQYYTGTVFEVFDRHPENKRALFGGGRYSDLAGLFTNQQVPGIGFGMGDVTLKDFLEVHGILPTATPQVDAVVIPLGADLLPQARVLARRLRLAGVRTATPLEPGKLTKELGLADRSGARVAVVVAPEELARETAVVRDLTTREQREVAVTDVAAEAARILGR